MTTLTELDELDARIPFGPRPNQTMPASWAAVMLTRWRDRQGLLHMVSGAASSTARCPNCHRRAVVQVDEGVIVPRLSWRQRLMVRALRRLTGEKWPAT